MRTKLEKLTAPCSYLDIEAFQSWLEDLSAQGYLLSSPGRMRHTYLFHRISPLSVRYRLTPVSDRFEDWNERPDTEEQSLSEAFGWDYVCTIGGFHIYRSYNDEDRELHSDPDVLAESLRLLWNKALRSAFAVFLSPLLYCLIIIALVGPGYFWQFMVRNGLMLYISFALLFLFTTIKGIHRSVKLWKLYFLLNARKLPVRYKNWKKGEKNFHISMAFTYLIGVLLILSVALFRVSGQDALRYQDHPNESSTLPFVTILELAERSDSKSAERLEAGGMVCCSQPLSPVNYEWAEIVDVTSRDGRKGRFSMELSYHVSSSDWLADRLTKEFMNEAESTGTPRENDVDFNVDLAYFYTDHRGCPAAVIRYENTVIKVCFVRMDFDDPYLNLDAWINFSATKAPLPAAVSTPNS